MKKIMIYLITLLSFNIIECKAQTGAQMQIYRFGGAIDTYNLSDIDSITFLPCTSLSNCGNVTDYDGNVYNSVTIGKQCWMQQNLKTTSYNDGTAIPLVTDVNTFYYLTTPAYCWFNDSTKFKNIYGALYNCITVYTGKLCPTGWHVPTYSEWDTLIIYLGGANVAGGPMKSTTEWFSPNVGATNSSGFSALPAGSLDMYNGGFADQGTTCYWWSSTESNSTYACSIRLQYDYAGASQITSGITQGSSVRCLKDSSSK